jgi:hypothetical protein
MRRVDSERRRERNALAAERGVLGLHERALDPDIPHTPGFGQEGRTWNNLRPEPSRFRDAGLESAVEGFGLPAYG